MSEGFRSCGSWALERGPLVVGTWAPLLLSMWGLPRPGIEPVSPPLTGGFAISRPPGKFRG